MFTSRPGVGFRPVVEHRPHTYKAPPEPAGLSLLLPKVIGKMERKRWQVSERHGASIEQTPLSLSLSFPSSPPSPQSLMDTLVADAAEAVRNLEAHILSLKDFSSN